MKIVLLVRILWTAGAQKKAIREAKALSELGHETEIIFLRKSQTLNGYEDLLEGVNYSIIVEHNDSLLVPLFDFITGMFAPDRKGDGRIDYNLIKIFPTYIKDKVIDLLICHDQFAGLAGYYAKKKLGISYCVLLHERLDNNRGIILSRLANYYERRTLLHASCLIASTNKIAQTVTQKYAIPCKTNYQGLDLKDFVKFENKENFLISVSMWDEGRKPHVYLDVIEKLPSYKLYLIGNWRSKILLQKFIDEIKERKLEEKVILKRNIKEAELYSFYNRSKFVIRFGFGEYGESHAVFEGLQCGVPVIVNSDLGSSELIKTYGVGKVVEEVTCEAVRDFVLESDNPAVYSAMQSRILTLAKDYTWESHAKTLLEALR